MRVTIFSAVLAGLLGLSASAVWADDCGTQCASLPLPIDRDACLTKCRILNPPPPGVKPSPPVIPPAKVVEPKPLDSNTPWRPPAALRPRD
jgi:hypothetical protein